MLEFTTNLFELLKKILAALTMLFDWLPGVMSSDSHPFFLHLHHRQRIEWMSFQTLNEK